METYRLLLRRDTAADWAAVNPILAEGEFGYETDTRKKKIGDGRTDWNNLPYDSIELPDNVATTDYVNQAINSAIIVTLNTDV